MKFKFVIIVCCLLLIGKGYSQDINGYKYIIIPKKFDFQKVENKYQLNSLTKFLFDKEGFLALVESEEQPEELYNNPCLGLKANVLDDSNLFTTKLRIQLTDCRGGVVYATEEGKSKIKDLKKGYHDALRKTFQPIKALDYKYDSKLSQKAVSSTGKINDETISNKNDIMKEADEDRKDEQPLVNTNDSKEDVSSDIKDEVRIKPEKNLDQGKKENLATEVNNDLNILYAQKIANGYQLVDNTPKIVFMALQSTTQDVYFLKNKAGILFKEGENWYVEYYDEANKLIKEQLNIKF